MTVRTSNHKGSASFAQANGSSCARASFSALLAVVDTVLAVSIFAILGILIARGLLLAAVVSVLLLAVVMILRGLILSPRPHARPGLSAA